MTKPHRDDILECGNHFYRAGSMFEGNTAQAERVKRGNVEFGNPKSIPQSGPQILDDKSQTSVESGAVGSVAFSKSTFIKLPFVIVGNGTNGCVSGIRWSSSAKSSSSFGNSCIEACIKSTSIRELSQLRKIHYKYSFSGQWPVANRSISKSLQNPFKGSAHNFWEFHQNNKEITEHAWHE